MTMFTLTMSTKPVPSSTLSEPKKKTSIDLLEDEEDVDTVCTDSSFLSCASSQGSSIDVEPLTVNSSCIRISRNNSIRRKGPQKLRFGYVDIIEFPCALGDNPSVSGGVPVCLAYHKELRRTRINLGGCTNTNKTQDYYQDLQKQKTKRSGDTLRLSPRERTDLLLSAKYTINDIIDGTLAADEIRHLRHETNKYTKKWDNVNDVLEKAGRIIFFGGKKK